MAYLLQKETINPESGKKEIYYRIGYRIEGKQQTLALGFVERKEAERLLKAYEGKRAMEAELPAEIAPRSSLTLGNLFEDRLIPYLRSLARAKATIRSAVGSAATFTRVLGEIKLGNLTSADIDRFVATRREEKVKTRTIQIELGHLSQALTLALEDKLIREIPKIRKPVRTDARPHVFHTPEQSAALVEALPWQQEPASALAIYAAIDLGARSGEIMSRRWEDVRWNQGKYGAIWIGPRLDEDGNLVWTTKTKRGRTVPLTASFADALRVWWVREGCPTAGWVFPSSRNPGYPLTSYKKALVGACQRAGLPLLHPHALRHSWATRMAISGIPKAVTMALGGWTTPVVLESIYQHSITNLEADAIQVASLQVAPSASSESNVIRLTTRLRKARQAG